MQHQVLVGINFVVRVIELHPLELRKMVLERSEDCQSDGDS